MPRGIPARTPSYKACDPVPVTPAENVLDVSVWPGGQMFAVLTPGRCLQVLRKDVAGPRMCWFMPSKSTNPAYTMGLPWLVCERARGCRSDGSARILTKHCPVSRVSEPYPERKLGAARCVPARPGGARHARSRAATRSRGGKHFFCDLQQEACQCGVAHASFRGQPDACSTTQLGARPAPTFANKGDPQLGISSS